MSPARRAVQALRRRLSPAAVITTPAGPAAGQAGGGCFVVVCGPGFDQRVPHAATTMRLGWCRGFEALGVPWRLVDSRALAAALDLLDDPMVWISCADHATLDRAGRAALARCRHAVLVDPAFDAADAWYARHGLPPLGMDESAVARVLGTGPRFVFTIAAPSGFGYYEQWLRTGVALRSLPLACDEALYDGGVAAAAGSGVDMAFVGGYWAYKARQFDHYLAPYAAHLTVYGWAAWPYGRYGGLLPAAQEPLLYRTARLSPVINEPHVPLMGIDVNERVFKVLGAGGLALTDATPAYREWFAPDELLVPASVAEYHALAAAAWAGELDTDGLRRRGRAAVLARHTYRHRALQFRAAMHDTVCAGA